MTSIKNKKIKIKIKKIFNHLCLEAYNKINKLNSTETIIETNHEQVKSIYLPGYDMFTSFL